MRSKRSWAAGSKKFPRRNSVFDTPLRWALSAAIASARGFTSVATTVSACRDASSAWMPFPAPTSSARATRRRTVSFASVTEGGWMPATQSASAGPSLSRSETIRRSPCGTNLTAARMPPCPGSSQPARLSASASSDPRARARSPADSVWPKRKSRTSAASGSWGASRRSCTARSAGDNEIRPPPSASSRRSVVYSTSARRARRASAWSCSGVRLLTTRSGRSSSDLGVLRQVPAARDRSTRCTVGVLRRVCHLDVVEVEPDRVMRRICACRLFERGDQHVAELDLQVLQLLRRRLADAQHRLFDVLATDAREKQLRRCFVHEHHELEVAELRTARSAPGPPACAWLGRPPAKRGERNPVLVLVILALARNPVDLEEIVLHRASHRWRHAAVRKVRGIVRPRLMPARAPALFSMMSLLPASVNTARSARMDALAKVAIYRMEV